MLTVDLIVCTMEEMKAMGAPMASLFGEAEPRTLDVGGVQINCPALVNEFRCVVCD